MAPGVPNTLANPSLQLRDSKGNPIAANDNWQSTIIGGAITSNQVSLIESKKLAPTNPNESALIVTLAPGDYTAIVNGSRGVQNIALVEVYDLDSFGASQLLNISTRGLIGTGDGVMIAGIIVGGTEDETVVMRGLGPSLGVSDPLPNRLCRSSTRRAISSRKTTIGSCRRMRPRSRAKASPRRTNPNLPCSKISRLEITPSSSRTAAAVPVSVWWKFTTSPTDDASTASATTFRVNRRARSSGSSMQRD
jgi:hypothetical protein